jgi:hypothetical protein
VIDHSVKIMDESKLLYEIYWLCNIEHYRLINISGK